MDPKNDQQPPEQSQPAETPPTPAPKKRFRIEKLEERITPKKTGGGQSSATDLIPNRSSLTIY